MRNRWRVFVGAAAGVAGAVIWAVTLAIYQPFMQPHGFWVDPSTGQQYPKIGEDNTYWPRDIRQLAILLALGGLILLSHVAVRGLVVGAVATLAWLGADLWLDRVDISGRTSAFWLAAAAIVGFAVTAVIATWLSTDRPGAVLGRHLAAGTAAVLAAGTVVVTTPFAEPLTDPDEIRVESALTVLKAALIVFFAVTVVALLAEDLTPARAGGVALFGVAAGVFAWASSEMYGKYLGLAMVGTIVAANLAVAVTRAVGAVRLAVLALGSAITIVFSVSLFYVGGMLAGTTMTELADNPPINSADTDLSYALLILALGVTLAGLSFLVTVKPLPVDHGVSHVV